MDHNWLVPDLPQVPDLRDAHLHLHDLAAHGDYRDNPWGPETSWLGLSSCHSPAEWQWHQELAASSAPGAWGFRLSYGIHPQQPDMTDMGFLEDLVDRKDPLLHAIGECGFDFFDPATGSTPDRLARQTRAFEAQLGLARSAGLPLVVHLRKATELIFHYSRELASLKAVIFHAWPSAWGEAQALLRRGVNAWFSLGTPLLRGNRKAMESMARLPADRVLLETDAPYQTLKGQDHTPAAALVPVCRRAAELRQTSFAEIARLTTGNFHKALDK